MSLRRIGLGLMAALAAFGLVTQTSMPAMAQNTGVQPAGVEISPEGVLRTLTVADPTGTLTRTRMAEARSRVDGDAMRHSELRKVSLVRLEEAIRERVEAGRPLTPEMLSLAGLTEIRYVFYYPETQDIVLAGPAEGFFEDVTGRTVGIETGKATLQLEDLVVALRTFAPGESRSTVIACSIDPTQEGLAAMQQFLANVNFRGLGDAPRIADGLKQSLGLQTVTLQGVPGSSHFAQVLVEADYRMKLIGIGLERPAAEIRSYVAIANPAEVRANALARWYFTPNYDCVRVSEDRNAMELVGSRVRLIGEDERVTNDGVRVAEGRRHNRASIAFTEGFTKQYDALATNSPVFAQLRNCMDLAIAAAYIQQQDFYGQSGWNMDLLQDESIVNVERLVEPQQVETAVNAVLKGNQLVTPIGGGVQIEAHRAIDPARVQVDQQGELSRAQGSVDPAAVDVNRWWWD
ncbi:MAG: DUF1598 domain-containing protein [Pirellulaceae bacterium]|nr:DUF1598 domain-containing protein [Planctomycetales bacterium]